VFLMCKRNIVIPDPVAIKKKYDQLTAGVSQIRFRDEIVQQELANIKEQRRNQFSAVRIRYILADFGMLLLILFDILVILGIARIVKGLKGSVAYDDACPTHFTAAKCALYQQNYKTTIYPNLSAKADLSVLQGNIVLWAYGFAFGLRMINLIYRIFWSICDATDGILYHAVLYYGTRRIVRRKSSAKFELVQEIIKGLSQDVQHSLWAFDRIRDGLVGFVVTAFRILVIVVLFEINQDSPTSEAKLASNNKGVAFLFIACTAGLLVMFLRLVAAIIMFPMYWKKLLRNRGLSFSSGVDFVRLLEFEISDHIHAKFDLNVRSNTYLDKRLTAADAKPLDGTLSVSSASAGEHMATSFSVASVEEREPIEIPGRPSFENTGMAAIPEPESLLIPWKDITIPPKFKPTRCFAYIIFAYNVIHVGIQAYGIVSSILIVIGLQKASLETEMLKYTTMKKQFVSKILLVAFIGLEAFTFLIYCMTSIKAYPKLKSMRISETFVNPVSRTFLNLTKGWRTFSYMSELRNYLHWTAWFGLLSHNFLFHTLWVLVTLPFQLFLCNQIYIQWQLIESEIATAIFGSYKYILLLKVVFSGIRVLLVSISLITLPCLRSHVARHLNTHYWDVSISLEKYLEASAELKILQTLHSQDEPNYE
jgi:hypothetical protein